ncbi:hypothetical protein ABZS29_11180 [Kribbella sp. NPDC005582]|uniref:hypothetical protein n=1 Tax=Kribbella sp. NPDC005582 TaxID=3156893 RepID=UPI0033B7DF22
MSEIFKGVRPLDYVLTALLSVAGLLLMYQNTVSTEATAHAVSTTSWAIVPSFLLVTLPILFRRRGILPVIAVTAVTTLGHVLAFGWLTRCGVAVPLVFALAYAVARFGGVLRNQLIGLAGVVVIQLVMLARDASIDTVLSGLALTIPGTALFYGIGLVVQNRVTKRSTGVALADQRQAA